MSEFDDVLETRAARRTRLTAEVIDLGSLIERLEQLDPGAAPDAKAIAAAETAPVEALADEAQATSEAFNAATQRLAADARAGAEADREEAVIAEQRRNSAMMRQQISLLQVDLADAREKEARNRRNLLIGGAVVAIVVLVIVTVIIIATGRG